MGESEILKPRFHVPLLRTVLFGRPLRIFCGECKKYIPSTMPWVCGHCDMQHSKVRVYTFLFKCKRCKRQPASVVCPHCGTVWSFDRKADATHPARRIPGPGIPPPIEDEDEKRRKAHERAKQETQFKIDEAKLAVELKDLEAKINGSGSKSPMEKLEEKFTSDQARFMGVKEIVAKWTKTYQERYRDDKEMFDDAMLFLKTWEAEHC